MRCKAMVACLPLLVLAPALASGDPLVGITIEPEVDVENGSKHDYERSLYRHWEDYDGDCQKVRHEVLIEESLVPVGFKDKQGTDEDTCVVETGLWFDPYNNRTFSRASDVQIDHMVPLKEVHQSGGYRWSKQRREEYANDRTNPGHLIAVRRKTNGEKGFKDPAEWMPDNERFRCAYVSIWTAIKRRWQLSMDSAEAEKIRAILQTCSVTAE